MHTIIKDIQGLGTTWSFEFFGEIDQLHIQAYLQKRIQYFNDQYSRFLDSSLLSQLNKSQKLDNPPVEFFDMLELAFEYYKVSGGVFNIATEQIQVANGYDKDYSFTPKNPAHKNNCSLLEILEFDSKSIVLKKEACLDLGGVGKGYLIDKLAEELRSKFGLQYFVINGGGDIYATSNQGEPISFCLEHPQKPGLYIGKILLENQGLCASSPFKRRWKDNQGEEVSHIINPHSADEKVSRSSFVISDKCVDADILATIFTLVSYDQAVKIRSKKPCEFAQIQNQSLKRSSGFIMKTLR